MEGLNGFKWKWIFNVKRRIQFLNSNYTEHLKNMKQNRLFINFKLIIIKIIIIIVNYDDDDDDDDDDDNDDDDDDDNDDDDIIN